MDDVCAATAGLCVYFHPHGMKHTYVVASAEMLSHQIKKVLKENILLRISDNFRMVKLEKDPRLAFILIIEKKKSSYVLIADMEHLCLNLAADFVNVIHCSISPKHKGHINIFL